jgi:uncharacterized protein
MYQITIILKFCSTILGWLLISHLVMAQELSAKPKRVAIIIDDMGVRLKEGRQILQLDPRLTLSFLPFEIHTQTLLKKAQKADREIMLHMPMESVVRLRQNKGVLRNGMDEIFLKKKLNDALKAVPNIVGVNNHRGSLLTQNERAMGWIMSVLKQRDLFFIDSKTTNKSVVAKVAKQWQVPSLSRHVFLDHSMEEDDINRQFDRMLQKVERSGEAIVIGHPQLPTISVLKKRLVELEQLSIEIVPISQFIHSHFTPGRLDLNTKNVLMEPSH